MTEYGFLVIADALKSGHGSMGDENSGYRMMVMGVLDIADTVLL